MSQSYTWKQDVDSRISIIADGLGSHDNLRKSLPGLKRLLDDYLDPKQAVGTDADQQSFHRRLLQVFRDSQADFTYEDWLQKLQPDERDRVVKFVDGKPAEDVCKEFRFGPSFGVRENIERLHKGAPVIVNGLNGDEDEDDGSIFRKLTCGLDLFASWQKHPIVVYKDVEFQNWGRTDEYMPSLTCIPSTVAGVQRIVKYAKAHDLGVRCAGFRHSWAPVFGRHGNITVSLLGLYEAAAIPNFTALSKGFAEPKPTQLESIEIVKGKARVPGNALVRIGASTTNERLRRWCVENKKYTYPLNIIMVEITVAGANSMICHGAGRRNTTLSDLVRRVEYVDCNGILRTVDDPDHLRAASGCFGLMGVITHLTLEFPPMTYALMMPQKIAAVRAVPPPDDMREQDIPAALRIAVTPEERRQDIARFEANCTNDYYAEYFWFPYSDKCWVNCWNDTPDPSGAVDYPSDAETFFMFLSQFTMNVLADSAVLTDLVTAVKLDTAAVTLISRVAMLSLPAWDKPVKTYLPDALHFRRGIQNVRVLDMELEMPLLPKPGRPDVPDFAVVRRAWWDAILECYKASATCPQRMPLEMRIMGGSDVIMAPQRGNALGTCAIEVLSLMSAKDIWKPYTEAVAAKWLSYKDANGRPLRTRPHWAKEWVAFDVDGRPWMERVKVDYKDDIVEFKKVLGKIGKRDGWTLADLKRRFSNDLFDDLIFGDVH